MKDVIELKDDDLKQVSGGTEVCSFGNGNTVSFEIGKFYYCNDRKELFKVVGQAELHDYDGCYWIPIEFYTLNKEYNGRGSLHVSDTTTQYEEAD